LIPWDPWLREIRADAYLGVGNPVHAISEMRALTKLTSDNTDGLFKLANLHYQLGEADPSLNEIRECLRLDPEHKVNAQLFKIQKSLEPEQWTQGIFNP
jgi:DnaJ family protein C protein 3